MMGYRKWAMIAGVPFLIATFFAISSFDFETGLLFLAIPVLVFAIPMWIKMFKLVNAMHGPIYATWHVLASVVLTPALLGGIILIPLVVRGDVNRLLLSQSREMTPSSGD